MPEVNLDDTIVAIATAAGVGAIGIVRMSGKESIAIASRMFQPKQLDKKLAECKSHTVHFGTIGLGGREMDQVLVTIFRKPNSYTTEDMVEISAHGGPQVLQAILALALFFGARQAQPGEFTRRAFLNGRIDLTQAEAVSDLISAKTERSAQVALRQLEGKLSAEIKKIKDSLMLLYANLEAYLDFPEEDLEVYSNQEFKTRFDNIGLSLEQLIATFSKGEILREGALTVIVGRPNVGKSSLLNALLERDRAIVSDIPGTTRDVLEESIVLNGIWIRLADTAGLAVSHHPIDRAAMERTKSYLDEGDLFLWVIDGSEGVVKEDEEIGTRLKGKKTIAVVNKKDLTQKIDIKKLKTQFDITTIVQISAKTSDGIDQLEKTISAMIVEDDLSSESAVITRMRHKHALEIALQRIEKSKTSFLKNESLEFVALDLKAALEALRELIGEVFSNDLLDVIFGEFCVGK
jgi:tRNA modification GTPase